MLQNKGVDQKSLRLIKKFLPLEKEEYDKYKLSADEEIRKLSEQLSALGIFSFSKKKELNARINGLQEHTVELKRNFDTSERTYYSLV